MFLRLFSILTKAFQFLNNNNKKGKHKNTVWCMYSHLISKNFLKLLTDEESGINQAKNMIAKIFM